MMKRDVGGEKDLKPEKGPAEKPIQFSLGSFDISVESTFLLTCGVLGMLLGMPSSSARLASAALHCASGILAVLMILIIHEAGHALCLRLFGYREIRVLFYGFGLSESLVRTPIPPKHVWRASLAGPLCNVVMGFLFIILSAAALKAAAGVESTPSEDSAIIYFFSKTGFYCLAFGIFGLVPIVPMDAGIALLKVLPPEKHKTVFTIGSAVAAAAALGCLANSSVFGTIVFGLIALKNWHFREADLAGKLSSAAKELVPLLQMLDDAWRSLHGGDIREAERLASLCLKMSSAPRLSVGACDVLAWTALASADPRKAQDYIERGRALSGGLFRALTQAMTSDALGDKKGALEFALAAAQSEPSSTSGKLVFKLLNETGDREGALKFADEFPWPEGIDVAALKSSASSIQSEAPSDAKSGEENDARPKEDHQDLS